MYWNGKMWHVEEIKLYVQSLVSSWHHAYSSTSAWSSNIMPPMHAGSNSSWCPPPEGFLKCNVDAALLDDIMGFGAVVRDQVGKFVAAFCRRLHCFRDPYLAETMAVKEALTWLKNYGHNNVILESDCLNFCTSFNSGCLNFSYVGLIIKHCSIANGIGNIVVRHVKRSANHVAHVLARATDSSSVLGVWDVSPPWCISDLVAF
ncbi:uncharacterized protein LOC116005928 [Ipomoea triloba]|uniref:uncharacterized protein LOC116005928 n=1 Tax=Ipomoea triloba TaxID=35885 RepID=UPI00125E6D81|nr:uncharacterized protein LOC116005928 [Ipomoea triloba]